MRLRYRAVLYQIEDGGQHYQDLVDDAVRQIQSYRAVSRRLATWRPFSDLHETPDAFIVKMELAGMAEEDIDVTLYTDAVIVSGTRRDEDMYADETSFHEAQIRYGPFQATIVLPTPIDRENAEAVYHNGFLRLRLPKKPAERLPVKPGKAIEAQGSDAPGDTLTEQLTSIDGDAADD